MGQITAPIQVLILEDDPDTAMLIADSLTDYFGPNCYRTIATLKEARTTSLDDVDLVLSDYHLPDGNGLQALEVLLERRSDIPVIMVTSEREIQTVTEAIRAGAYDYVVKSDQMFEMIPLTIEKNLEVSRIKQQNTKLQKDLEDSLQQIRESNAQLSEMVDRLEAMAHTDALTGVFNRRHLNNILGRMFAESHRYHTELTCLMMDLDGFKSVNDTLGHQCGDEVLVAMARVIRDTAREADIAARYGGDEFVILMPHTNGKTAMMFVERLRVRFASCWQEVIGDQHADSISLSVSVGVASTRMSHPRSGEELIVHADNALYAAKNAGKDRIMIWDAESGHPVDPTAWPQRQSA